MEKFIDRFANWLFTACVLFIGIVLTRYMIDNFRVILNITLIVVALIGSGALVYEGVNKFRRKK